MSGLRFVGDVPIGRATIEFLKSLSHDAIRAVERLPPTALDEQLVQLVADEQRIVLCFDLELAALVAGSQARLPNVVTFRTRRRSAGFLKELRRSALPVIRTDLERGAP